MALGGPYKPVPQSKNKDVCRETDLRVAPGTLGSSLPLAVCLQLRTQTFWPDTVIRTPSVLGSNVLCHNSRMPLPSYHPDLDYRFASHGRCPHHQQQAVAAVSIGIPQKPVTIELR